MGSIGSGSMSYSGHWNQVKSWGEAHFANQAIRFWLTERSYPESDTRFEFADPENLSGATFWIPIIIFYNHVLWNWGKNRPKFKAFYESSSPTRAKLRIHHCSYHFTDLGGGRDGEWTHLKSILWECARPKWPKFAQKLQFPEISWALAPQLEPEPP